MRFADGHGAREQQVHLDQLPVSGGTEAHTMILQSQFTADGESSLSRISLPTSGSEWSSKPKAERQTRCPPVQRMLIATAIASKGSNGFQPVSITRPSPATTPKLVQLSVSTCLPFASRIRD